tara:strand:+ start:36746 stop:38536 length:1791 start_codon:yes stop_codon:yes gene_type:complete
MTACEALTGSRPSGVEEAAKHLRGAMIPRYAIRAICRGLASDPAQRYPTTKDFAAALGSPNRTKKIALAVAGVATVTALVVLLLPAPVAAVPCATSVDAVSATWRDLQPQLNTRFAAKDQQWPSLRSYVDSYVAVLEKSRTEQCVEIAEGKTGAYARVSCLEQGTRTLAGFFAALEGASAESLPAGASLSALLPELSSCAQANPSLSATPTSSDSMALDATLEQVRALAWFGDFERAKRDATEVLVTANDLGAIAIIAKANVVLASIAYEQGDRKTARDLYETAAETAERSGDDPLRVNALLGQLLVSDTLEEGQAIARRAEAIVERLDDPNQRAVFHRRRGLFQIYHGEITKALEDLEVARSILVNLLGDSSAAVVDVDSNIAAAYQLLGRNEESVALLRRVIAFQREAGGPENRKVAQNLMSLAGVVGQDEAVELLSEAVSVFRALYGDDNPRTIHALTNRCSVETQVDAKAALVGCRQAVASAEMLYGNDAPEMAWTLTALGIALLTAEEHKAAREVLERGLNLAADPPRYPNEVADLRYYLAAALASTGEDPKRALSLAQQARETWLTSPRRQESMAGVDELIATLENADQP